MMFLNYVVMAWNSIFSLRRCFHHDELSFWHESGTPSSEWGVVGSAQGCPLVAVCSLRSLSLSLSGMKVKDHPQSGESLDQPSVVFLLLYACATEISMNWKKWDFHPKWKEWHHTSGTQNPEMCQLTLRMKFTRCKHDNYWTDEREGPTPLHPEELHHMCNWNWNPLMHRRTMPLVLYEFGLEGPTQIVHR